MPSPEKFEHRTNRETQEGSKRGLGTGCTSLKLQFSGLALTLDSSGAIWIEQQDTLIVSDLHLEKGSGAAARGRLVPSLDSHDTLLRLRRVIETYRPARLICLGDSFHDRFAGERMAAPDRAALKALCDLVEAWVWVSGNHDPEAPAFCEGERRDDVQIGAVTLRHEPDPEISGAQIVGHFHPKASVAAGGRRFSGRCFSVSDDLLIMPAFGAYAGGLPCAGAVIASLHKSKAKTFMVHAAKIWRVA